VDEVTVVIPAYNAERFIEDAIESALQQAPHVVEVIVVDDGSTDGTRDVVRSNRNSIVTLLELEHSGNASAARNRGIERASTPLVAFLDADDVWLAGKIGMQAAVLAESQSLGLVCTNAYRQSEPGQREGMTELLPPGAGPHDGGPIDALLLDNFVVMSSVLARRSAILEVGGFSEAEDLALVADYDLWVRMAPKSGLRYVRTPWLIYRDWGSSYRDEWSAVGTAEAVLRVLSRAADSIPGLAREHSRALSARRAMLYAEIADSALTAGDRPRARSASVSAIKHAPSSPRSWKAFARSIAR
jgi:glycosyltransferase involved in cell wall biosynthesis